MTRVQVVYDVVYAVEIGSTGVSSDPDIVYADTPAAAGRAVEEALSRAESWQWISVRRQEIPARGAQPEASTAS